MGGIRSFALGSVPRILITTVVVLAVAVGAGFGLGVLGVPGLDGVSNAFGDVNETTTAIETELAVQNPNPVGVSLGGLEVDYSVRMNEVEMATGAKRGVAVPAGNSTVNLTTYMRNERIPAWWVSHVRRGEHTTVHISAEAHSGVLGRNVSLPPVTRQIQTDMISQFNSTETRPVNASQPPIEDPVLYVNETSAAWGAVSDAETPIRIRFTVYNPNSVPVPITELGYDISMNDVAVGDGATDRTYTVPPRDTRTLEATVVIRNEHLDEWWVSHLRRNQVTDLRIDFDARIDTAVAGTVSVPLRGVDYERTIETDIFGTKGSPDRGGSEGSTNGTGSGDSTDDTGSGDSPDGTTAAGSSSTGTPSTTPDSTTGTTTSGGLLDTTTANGTTEDGGILGDVQVPWDRGATTWLPAVEAVEHDAGRMGRGSFIPVGENPVSYVVE